MSDPTSIETVVQLVQAHAWWALGAIAIGGLVRLTKSDTPIPGWTGLAPAWRARLALGLGAVQVAVEALAASKPWQEALLDGALAALAAIAGHEVVVEGFRGGRELGESDEVVK